MYGRCRSTTGYQIRRTLEILTADESKAGMPVNQSEEEEITITIMQELFSDQAPDTDNEWYNKLEEMTGVKLEVNFVPTLSYVYHGSGFWNGRIYGGDGLYEKAL